MATIKLNDILVGDNNPTFIIAEIGINHQGDINIAKELQLYIVTSIDPTQVSNPKTDCIKPFQKLEIK